MGKPAHGQSLGGGRTHPSNTGPSTLRPIHHCGSDVPHVTPSTGFPILTIALTCFMCGFVFEYIDDDTAIERYRKATDGKERPPRPWVVSHRTAREVEFDEQEELLVKMLESGKHYAKVAEELDLPVGYVQAIWLLTPTASHSDGRFRARTVGQRLRMPEGQRRRHQIARQANV
jgi:hypothetical protein